MVTTDLTQQERDMIFGLARELTGIMTDQRSRYEILVQNVCRRIQAAGCQTLQGYLGYVTANGRELQHLISALSIHTTSWFREMPHFRNLERDLLALCSRTAQPLCFRLLSAACSSGEELYSFGMVLENVRRRFPHFEYELVGVDVDPVSVERAETGTYVIDNMESIPHMYRRFLVDDRAGGVLGKKVIDSAIRSRSRFQVGNLLQPWEGHFEPFDQVVCRNVLIYFHKDELDRIVRNLLSLVKPAGLLTLGHCEIINGQPYNLAGLGNCTYQRVTAKAVRPADCSGTVLVVDDSAAIRAWMRKALEDEGFKVATVESAEEATAHLARNPVDLITLDMNLPGQYGLAWLEEARKRGMAVPVILLTDASPDEAPAMLDALGSLAQDYLKKDSAGMQPSEVGDRITSLIVAYRGKWNRCAEASADGAPRRSPSRVELRRPDLILLGASTGGTEALSQVLANMPEDSPPVLCVQHIQTEFAGAFLERLSVASRLKPGVIGSGELLPGHIYLSVEDAHLGVRRVPGGMVSYLSREDPVAGHRPSVDYLFQSAANLKDVQILAGLLTGMGRDGARGLLALRQMGAITLAQDEASSVVWGMPGEATKLGAPLLTGNLRDIRAWIQMALRASEGEGMALRRRVG